jgi:hypothetical protein
MSNIKHVSFGGLSSVVYGVSCQSIGVLDCFFSSAFAVLKCLLPAHAAPA